MTETVSLTISAAKDKFKSGEPLELSISLKNSGAEPVSVVQRSEWLNHILTVTDARGKNVPETSHAKQAKEGAQAGYRTTLRISSGEEIRETLDLYKAFEIKKPGIYKITSHRHVSQGQVFEQPVLVKSNELTIQIIP